MKDFDLELKLEEEEEEEEEEEDEEEVSKREGLLESWPGSSTICLVKNQE